MEWTYESKPTSEFIKLPDGTIINVAHVRRVYKFEDGDIGIDVGMKNHKSHYIPSAFYDDPDGKIYAWFAERAVEVGGES